MNFPFERYAQILEKEQLQLRMGKVKKVIGIIIHAVGLKVFVGEVCDILISEENRIPAEVVGFEDDGVLLMPLGDLQGIGPGCLVLPTGKALVVKVGDDLLGTTLDGLGRPMDGEARRLEGYGDINRMPPNPFQRKKIEAVMSTGVKAIDGLLTVGEGQRIGIFAGSGVGKSTLLGMISRYCDADVNVIGLIGERGREVLEFIQRDLGDEGYRRSVVICATSDQPPLVRLKGAYVATAIAEYFRDQGKKVMFMMDSVTRFAMAQREIGLAIGEPPTTRGYTPSVFAALPKLLERSGMSQDGSITAFYTVLVEGDDMNEPIADAVRGILDGHIVLTRKLAGKNHFPAIDVQQSVSRVMKEIVSKEHYDHAGKLKENISRYQESEDLINVGAYAKGRNPEVDRAIELKVPIDQFLRQSVEDSWTYDKTVSALKDLFKR
ncbi:flagellar protein export ATPase FliI [Proteiniclasticum sp. BAD-10]|uniref:Flagellar protein export ATPase FliI n=1 Tax=Proteiniclasticum sediminis TaxID=2804028 RepID=A0A941CNI1_9CLOT|nr:flagellar protein export ATPase FliI [Proteiniclasticum sediminis]MBR0575960.1 flagellar protein export ATPase FliI [Proteiniclasticum sediminis]